MEYNLDLQDISIGTNHILVLGSHMLLGAMILDSADPKGNWINGSGVQ